MMDFLSAIWPETAPLGEIRTIKQGAVSRQWFDPGDITDMLAMQSYIALSDQQGADVYFGVLPRIRRGSAAIDVLAEAKVLWVDIDSKNMPSYLDSPFYQKREAWHRLGQIDPTPSIIVDSGNGYHAYWLLNQVVEWRTAEAIMRGIAAAISADHVYDRPRILRVPGTHNHKNEPPTPVRLMRFDRDRLWRPGAFVDFRDRGLEIMEPATTGGAAFDNVPLVEYYRYGAPLPEWLTTKIRTRGDDRSAHAFSTALWLLRFGYSDNAIIDIFTENPDGVGNKFYEKGGPGTPGGMRWLQHTINRAKEIA